MMIAVPAEEKGSAAAVSTRFARAPWYVLYDSETGEWSALQNVQALDSSQGAGIQAAQLLERAQVRVVLTPHCGPKAFRVLQAASIAVCLAGGGTVEQVVGRYLAGELTPATGADVEGHW